MADFNNRNPFDVLSPYVAAKATPVRDTVRLTPAERKFNAVISGMQDEIGIEGPLIEDTSRALGYLGNLGVQAASGAASAAGSIVSAATTPTTPPSQSTWDAMQVLDAADAVGATMTPETQLANEYLDSTADTEVAPMLAGRAYEISQMSPAAKALVLSKMTIPEKIALGVATNREVYENYQTQQLRGQEIRDTFDISSVVNTVNQDIMQEEATTEWMATQRERNDASARMNTAVDNWFSEGGTSADLLDAIGGATDLASNTIGPVAKAALSNPEALGEVGAQSLGYIAAAGGLLRAAALGLGTRNEALSKAEEAYRAQNRGLGPSGEQMEDAEFWANTQGAAEAIGAGVGGRMLSGSFAARKLAPTSARTEAKTAQQLSKDVLDLRRSRAALAAAKTPEQQALAATQVAKNQAILDARIALRDATTRGSTQKTLRGLQSNLAKAEGQGLARRVAGKAAGAATTTAPVMAAEAAQEIAVAYAEAKAQGREPEAKDLAMAGTLGALLGAGFKGGTSTVSTLKSFFDKNPDVLGPDSQELFNKYAAQAELYEQTEALLQQSTTPANIQAEILNKLSLSAQAAKDAFVSSLGIDDRNIMVMEEYQGKELGKATEARKEAIGEVKQSQKRVTKAREDVVTARIERAIYAESDTELQATQAAATARAEQAKKAAAALASKFSLSPAQQAAIEQNLIQVQEEQYRADTAAKTVENLKGAVAEAGSAAVEALDIKRSKQTEKTKTKQKQVKPRQEAAAKEAENLTSKFTQGAKDQQRAVKAKPRGKTFFSHGNLTKLSDEELESLSQETLTPAQRMAVTTAQTVRSTDFQKVSDEIRQGGTSEELGRRVTGVTEHMAKVADAAVAGDVDALNKALEDFRTWTGKQQAKNSAFTKALAQYDANPEKGPIKLSGYNVGKTNTPWSISNNTRDMIGKMNADTYFVESNFNKMVSEARQQFGTKIAPKQVKRTVNKKVSDIPAAPKPSSTRRTTPVVNPDPGTLNLEGEGEAAPVVEEAPAPTQEGAPAAPAATPTGTPASSTTAPVDAGTATTEAAPVEAEVAEGELDGRVKAKTLESPLGPVNPVLDNFDTSMTPEFFTEVDETASADEQAQAELNSAIQQFITRQLTPALLKMKLTSGFGKGQAVQDSVAKYANQNPLFSLITEEGLFEPEVMQAMAKAIFKWAAMDAGSYTPADQMSLGEIFDVVGFDKNSEYSPIPYKQALLLSGVGDAQSTLISPLGRYVFESLGWETKSNATNHNAAAEFQAAIGKVLLNALIDENIGMVTAQTTGSKTIVDAIGNWLPADSEYKNKPYTGFIPTNDTVLDENGREQLAEVTRTIRETVSMYKKQLLNQGENLDNLPSGERPTKINNKIPKSPGQVSNAITETSLNNLQSVGWQLDPHNEGIFSATGLHNYEDFMFRILGGKTDAELKEMLPDLQNTAAEKNERIKKLINNFSKVQQTISESATAAVYYKYKLASNLRVFIDNSGWNPQGDTMVRYTMKMEGSEATISAAELAGMDNAALMQLAEQAQNGVLNAEQVPLADFLARVGNNLGYEYAKYTVGDTIRKAISDMSRPEIQAGIRALSEIRAMGQSIDGGMATEAQMLTITNAIEKMKINPTQAILVMGTWGDYTNAAKNGTSFSHALPLEYDGTTSGAGILVSLFPNQDLSLQTRVGNQSAIFTNQSKSLMDQKTNDPTHLDAYETLAVNILNGVKEADQDVQNYWKNIIGILGADFTYETDDSGKITVTKTARNAVKPLMMTPVVYGSGTTSALEVFLRDNVLPKAIKDIQKILDAKLKPSEAKGQIQAVLDNLGGLTGKAGYRFTLHADANKKPVVTVSKVYPNGKVNPTYDAWSMPLKEFKINQGALTAMEKEVGSTMNEIVSTALDATYRKPRYGKDALGAVINTSADMYAETYNFVREQWLEAEFVKAWTDGSPFKDMFPDEAKALNFYKQNRKTSAAEEKAMHKALLPIQIRLQGWTANENNREEWLSMMQFEKGTGAQVQVHDLTGNNPNIPQRTYTPTEDRKMTSLGAGLNAKIIATNDANIIHMLANKDPRFLNEHDAVLAGATASQDALDVVNHLFRSMLTEYNLPAAMLNSVTPYMEFLQDPMARRNMWMNLGLTHEGKTAAQVEAAFQKHMTDELGGKKKGSEQKGKDFQKGIDRYYTAANNFFDEESGASPHTIEDLMGNPRFVQNLLRELQRDYVDYFNAAHEQWATGVTAVAQYSGAPNQSSTNQQELVSAYDIQKEAEKRKAEQKKANKEIRGLKAQSLKLQRSKRRAEREAKQAHKEVKALVDAGIRGKQVVAQRDIEDAAAAKGKEAKEQIEAIEKQIAKLEADKQKVNLPKQGAYAIDARKDDSPENTLATTARTTADNSTDMLNSVAGRKTAEGPVHEEEVPSDEASTKFSHGSDATAQPLGTEEYMDVTAASLMGVFNQLVNMPDATVRISDEHAEFLRGILDTYIKLGGDTINLTIQDVIGATSFGQINATDILINNALGQGSTLPTSNVGSLRASSAEVLVHELVHFVSNVAVDKDFKMRTIMQQFWKAARTELMLPHNAALYADNKQMFDRVFNPQGEADGSSDYLHEFLAYGVTNQAMRQLLQRVPTTRQQDAWFSGNTVFEKILNLFMKVMEIFNKKVKQKTAGTLDQEMLNILQRAATINANHNGVSTKAISRGFQALDGKLEQYTPKLHKMLNKGWMAIPKAKGKAWSAVTAPVNLAFTAMNWKNTPVMAQNINQKVSNMVAHMHKSQNAAMREIAAIATETQGQVGKNAATTNAIRQTKHQVDKMRMQMITAIQNDIRSAFDGLTDAESESLTYVLAKSDFVSLLDKRMAWSEQMGYITSPAVRARSITDLEEQLAKLVPSKRERNYYTLQAQNLGQMMMVGQSALEVPGLNGYTISRGFDGAHKPAVEAIVEQLATLHALQYAPAQHMARAADVVTRELARGTPENGITVTVSTLAGIKSESLKHFKNQRDSMRKGYIKELFDPNGAIQISNTPNNKVLLDQGYKVLYQLPADSTFPQTAPSYLYHSPYGAPNNWIGGGFSMLQKKAKGTDVMDGGYTSAQINQATQAKQRRDARAYATGKLPKLVDQGVVSIPVYDTNGDVIKYRYEMNDTGRNNILKRDNALDRVLATTAAQLRSVPVIQKQNSNMVQALNQVFNQYYDAAPEEFVFVSPTATDKKLQDYWHMLPRETQQEAMDTFGMVAIPVRAAELHGVFGRRDISLRDIWQKDTLDRNIVEQAFYTVATQFWGQEAANNIKKYGDIWTGLVAYAKDTVVVRSFVVAWDNTISNLQLLATHGVNPLTTLANYPKVYGALEQYKKDNARQFQIQNRLANEKLSTKERADLNRELTIINDNYASSPIKHMIDAGLLQNIEDLGELRGEPLFEGIPFLEKINDIDTSKVPGWMKVPARNIAVMRDSSVYRFLSDFATMGDFVSKYTLIEHNMNRKKNPLPLQLAIQEASNLFIDYDAPTGIWTQYLNDIGIFMFSKYLVRVQKQILNTAIQRPLQSLLTMGGANALGLDMSIFGSLAGVTTNPLSRIMLPGEVLGGLTEALPSQVMEAVLF